MKKRIFSFLIGVLSVLCFVSVTAVAAAETETVYRTSFYFQNSSTEGFDEYAATLTPSKDALKISNNTIGGGAMARLSEDNGGLVNASANRYVTLLIQNNTGDSLMKIGFIRTTDPLAITNDKKVEVPITPHSDGYQYVTVDMSMNSLWEGDVSILLLECPLGSVSIKSMVFSNERVTYAFGSGKEGFFETNNDSAVSAQNGELVISAGTNGGAKNEALQVNASKYKFARLIVKNETDDAIKFRFGNEGGGAVEVSRNVPKDGNYYHIVLDFSNETAWNGTISFVEILSSAGTVRVREITFAEDADLELNLTPVDDTVLEYFFFQDTGIATGNVRNLNEALCITYPGEAKMTFSDIRKAPNLSKTPYVALTVWNQTDVDSLTLKYVTEDGEGSVSKSLTFEKDCYYVTVIELADGVGKLQELYIDCEGTGSLLVDSVQFMDEVPSELDGSKSTKALPETGWDLTASPCDFFYLEQGNTLVWDANRLVYTFGSDNYATVVKSVSGVKGVDLEKYKYIIFRIRNNSDAESMSFYWGTNEEPINTEEKKYTLTLKSYETEYTNYLADLKNEQNYSGYLSGNFFMRFYSKVCAGTVEIESITFYSSLEEIIQDGIEFYVAPIERYDAILPESNIGTVLPAKEAGRIVPLWLSVSLCSLGAVLLIASGVLLVVRRKKA